MTTTNGLPTSLGRQLELNGNFADAKANKGETEYLYFVEITERGFCLVYAEDEDTFTAEYRRLEMGDNSFYLISAFAKTHRLVLIHQATRRQVASMRH